MIEHEEAVKKARAMLAAGMVAGVSQRDDALMAPSEERVAELALLIESGAVDAVTLLTEVK